VPIIDKQRHYDSVRWGVLVCCQLSVLHALVLMGTANWRINVSNTRIVIFLLFDARLRSSTAEQWIPGPKGTNLDYCLIRVWQFSWEHISTHSFVVSMSFGCSVRRSNRLVVTSFDIFCISKRLVVTSFDNDLVNRVTSPRVKNTFDCSPVPGNHI
jgi:hypothetical protein